MLGLRYCTMLCKDAEYKNMNQDTSLGQLYDVQNKIKILYKAKVGPTHFLLHTHSLSLAAIDLREYIDCSLAQPACLVLVE
jgi:hypothetical protein